MDTSHFEVEIKLQYASIRDLISDPGLITGVVQKWPILGNTGA